MDVVNEDVAAAAGQLSQADIIERQAEAIARLKRQVRKGDEYKQLTKSKLKEAAARLKEYRLRVEALQRELQEEQEKAFCKKQLKRAVVKAKKHVKDASSQTEKVAETLTLTRACQTQLSGPVQRVNKKTLVDNGASRKRGREHVSTSTQTEADQLVPRLTRDLNDVDTQVLAEDTADGQTAAMWTSSEPLQLQVPMLGASDSAFPHETSAALDAELAFSDSGDGEAGAGQEEAAVKMKSSAGLVGSFDPTVLDEIDQELASSSDEDDGGGEKSKQEEEHGGKGSGGDRTAAGSVQTAGVSLLDGLDSAVLNEIDKDLETSSGEEDGDENDDGGGAVSASKVNTDVTGGRKATGGDSHAGTATGSGFSLLGALDPAISSTIDDDLATSSDDEDGKDEPDTRANPEEASQTGLANGAGANVSNDSRGKRTLMSIDDELDDEFAALNSDSEPEHQEKKHVDGNKEDVDSSSSSDSGDSDSSDSSDSDSDGDADDPMTGNADKNEVSLTHCETGTAESTTLPQSSSLAASSVAAAFTQIPNSDISEATAQQTEGDGERRALSPSIVGKDAVVLTTPVQKKPVTAAEDVYSPIVGEVELQPKSPEPLRLNSSAEPIVHSEERPSVYPAPQQSPVQEHVPDAIEASKAASKKITTAAETIETTDVETSSADANTSSLPSSKRPTPMISPSIPNKPTPSADSTDSATTTSAALSLHSAVISMVETVEPADQEDSSGSQSLPDAQTSGVISPTKGVAVGKARKAEEANLDDTQAVTQKKIKLSGGVSAQVGGVMQERNPHTSATADSKKAEKKPAARSESKEEVRMKKSLAAFTKAIILSKGEEADKDYARRTIALLVNQSSKFVDTNLAHVKMLCQVLADSYRELGVFPMMVLRGTLGIFRAPRSRRLMLDRKLGLSWLCHELLLKLMRTSDEASIALGSLCLSLVEECLQHLRGFLVEERTNIGDSMSSSKIQVQVATRQISVSHDKVFLAHICALHTHLCKSTGQLARSRVLLFDLLRGNPNIRGLYFAAITVEIYPAMLERSFDQHCVERQDTLKETLLQVLIAIGCVAAERQELVLHQSSHTMLHRIADAIQMREMEVIDGANPNFSRTWVQTLYDKLSASCRPFNPETAPAAENYELAKSLEICTAVFGLDLVAQIFSIDRCQELFSRATLEAKSGIISVVSHIALAAAPKTSDTQNPRTRSELYVESTIDWLHHVLVETNDDETSTDDRFKLLAKCAAVCVEVVLGYSAAAGLDTRRRGLCAVVRWFEAAPPDQLVGLPASFVRRLRLAVVATRPQMVRAAVLRSKYKTLITTGC